MHIVLISILLMVVLWLFLVCFFWPTTQPHQSGIKVVQMQPDSSVILAVVKG